MHWFVTRRVTPQTVGVHFAFEEIESARSDAIGGWRDRQHPRGQRSRENAWLTNILTSHVRCRRNFNRKFTTGKLHRLEIGDASFNRALDS